MATAARFMPLTVRGTASCQTITTERLSPSANAAYKADARGGMVGCSL